MQRPAASSDEMKRLHRLATLMDEAFTIPGTRIRVGLDSLIGLIPGIGDSVGLATSGYIIVQARRYGLRKRVLMRMVSNSLIDFVVGSIPLLGDAFDVYFKAHRRNANLLERELQRLDAASGP